MNDTIQLALEGGGSIALPRAQLAEQLAADIIANLRAKAAQQVPAYPLGQFVPSQGGIYIGARLIDGRVHHRFIAERNHHLVGIRFDGITKALTDKGSINGFNDWQCAAQEDLMLSFIHALSIFPRSGTESIYWSGKPFDSFSAWALGFEYGSVRYWGRYHELAVLPVRSVIA